MATKFNVGLEAEFGQELTNTLTAVYAEVLESILQSRTYKIVPRDIRLHIVHALISEAESGETDCTCLKNAAFLAFARHEQVALTSN